MGEVLRLQPVVRVERWAAGWLVTVRPCPDGIASCRTFDREADAAKYATALKAEHGWRIRPLQFDVATSPPEAA